MQNDSKFYHYSEVTGVLTATANVEEFKRQRFLESDNGSLSGCIEKNGKMGKIDVTPFEITVKGLDSDFDF